MGSSPANLPNTRSQTCCDGAAVKPRWSRNGLRGIPPCQTPTMRIGRCGFTNSAVSVPAPVELRGRATAFRVGALDRPPNLMLLGLLVFWHTASRALSRRSPHLARHRGHIAAARVQRERRRPGRSRTPVASAHSSQSRRPGEGCLQPVSGEAPVAGHGSGSAAHLAGDLLARQAFEHSEFHCPPKGRVDGSEPVQNIVDFNQRMFRGGMRASHR
jgi:hypothetical protein